MYKKALIAALAAVAVLVAAGVLLYPYLDQRWAYWQLKQDGFTDLRRGERRVPVEEMPAGPIGRAMREIPFVQTVCEDRHDAAMLFIRAGFNVNARGDHDVTPLHCAALLGDLALVNALLMRGADPAAVDGRMGLQAIHLAAVHHRFEIIQTLLHAGASINAMSPMGTPLLLALKRQKSPGRWIVARNALSDKEYTQPSIGVLERLVELGADPRLSDPEGNTLLHIAAQSAQMPLIDAVMSHGLSLDAKNKAGQTPLIYGARESATLSEQTQLVAGLLDRGADVNAQDREGQGILHVVSENKDAVALLLARGLDLNAPGSTSGRRSVPTQ
jgi:ankyrin repeat protein